jgi:hypothetical protein
MSNAIRSSRDTILTGNNANFQTSQAGEFMKLNQLSKNSHEQYQPSAAIRGKFDISGRVQNLEGSPVKTGHAPKTDVYGRPQPFNKPNIPGESPLQVPAYSSASRTSAAVYANMKANHQPEDFKPHSSMGVNGSFSKKEKFVRKIEGYGAKTSGDGSSGRMTLAEQRKKLVTDEKFAPKLSDNDTGRLTLAEQRERLVEDELA